MKKNNPNIYSQAKMNLAKAAEIHLFTRVSVVFICVEA